MHKLLLNFTVVGEPEGLEENGATCSRAEFLGLDNVGPFDRSALPVAGHLEQSDGTSWMASYSIGMLQLALTLAHKDPTYEDIATKFFEHFALIATALNDMGLWNEDDGFYYDLLHLGDGRAIPLQARSLVGLMPLTAVTTLPDDLLELMPDFANRVAWFTANRPEARGHHPAGGEHARSQDGSRMLSIVSEDRLRRLLAAMLDPAEFLSDHGIRSLSRRHLAEPLHVDIDGVIATLDYEPAGVGQRPVRRQLELARARLDADELHPAPGSAPPRRGARAGLQGRMPDRLGSRCEHSTRSPRSCRDRLIRLFLRGFPDGRRPVFGGYRIPQEDPAWRDLILFHEYFHGDTGAGSAPRTRRAGPASSPTSSSESTGGPSHEPEREGRDRHRRRERDRQGDRRRACRSRSRGLHQLLRRL